MVEIYAELLFFVGLKAFKTQNLGKTIWMFEFVAAWIGITGPALGISTDGFEILRDLQQNVTEFKINYLKAVLLPFLSKNR